MGIVFACIVPHGAETIPQLAGGKLEAFAKTRRGMEKLASLIRKQNIETIVIATPHNLRLEGFVGVVTAEFAEGSLRTEHGQVSLSFRCNRVLAREILRLSKEAGLPVVGVNYGTSEGDASRMPMDWGTIIPLWFLGVQQPRKPEIVIVTPSREIPLDSLVKFGGLVAQAAKQSKTRIAFVASADQGHAHDLKGPYGFHRASAEYDKLVEKAVKGDRLKSLLDLDRQFVEDAKPDSLWQIAVLVGVLERAALKSHFISYDAPTYYGMLCAAYMPRLDEKKNK